MIITEEEAKTKLCPEAIGVGDINWVTVPTGRMCIGSACMAWRWHRGSLYIPDPLEKASFTEIEGKGEYSTTHGYCGKAGKP